MADNPADTRVIQPQQAAGFVGFQLTNSPWPAPQIIREYEAIAPGLGAKILDAIPREQQFQQDLAGRKLTLEFVSILIGQIFGLLTALAAIGGAIWLGQIGQPIPATALSSFGTPTL